VLQKYSKKIFEFKFELKPRYISWSLLMDHVDWWSRDLQLELWVRVTLHVCLFEQRLLPLLLLAMDVDCLPKLC
jgi:hypothetical protein